MRPIIKPMFEHEVSSVVQSKDKKSGAMYGEYELVYDQETDSWVARSTKQQISMFDPEAQGEAEAAESDPKGLPAPVDALPAEGSVDSDDDDFTEADAYDEDEEPDSEDAEDDEE